MICSLFILHNSSFIIDVYGAFKDPGFGARPQGMGGAFTAISDDAHAPLYNPAGMVQAERARADFMYARLFHGLDTVDLGLQYAAFVIPAGNIGSFGISWSNLTALSQYKEDSVSFSYARTLVTRPLPFALGMTVKYLQSAYTLDTYTINDPVFATGSSKSNYTGDIGLWSVLHKGKGNAVTAGIAVKNVPQPDMGISIPDTVPTETRIGFGYSVSAAGPFKELLSGFDIAYRNAQSEKIEDNINLHLGSEAWLLNGVLGLRLGGHLNGITGGFSIKAASGASSVRLDYALLWPLHIQSTTGSHRISLSRGF